MPAMPRSDLGLRIAQALELSGRSVIVVGSPASQPRRYRVSTETDYLEVWVYAWTVTHGGGRARPPGERRIQMTSVTPPLAMNPQGPTLLIGYYPDLDVFAGFDIVRHQMFTAGSPSVQVDITALEKCIEQGLALDRKDNGELAIGVRPDALFEYVEISRQLHAMGTDDATAAMVEVVMTGAGADPGELAALPAERRRIVAVISRLARWQGFRRKILAAYENRCAITRMQLNLVEAAHLVPVAQPGSTDRTQNGIALSPTYHRAFDARLIYLDEDYKFKVNPDRRAWLLSHGRSDGLSELEGQMSRPIFLPAEGSLRPTLSIIRASKRARGIP